MVTDRGTAMKRWGVHLYAISVAAHCVLSRWRIFGQRI